MIHRKPRTTRTSVNDESAPQPAGRTTACSGSLPSRRTFLPRPRCPGGTTAPRAPTPRTGRGGHPGQLGHRRRHGEQVLQHLDAGHDVCAAVGQRQQPASATTRRHGQAARRETLSRRYSTPTTWPGGPRAQHRSSRSPSPTPTSTTVPSGPTTARSRRSGRGGVARRGWTSHARRRLTRRLLNAPAPNRWGAARPCQRRRVSRRRYVLVGLASRGRAAVAGWAGRACGPGATGRAHRSAPAARRPRPPTRRSRSGGAR